MKKLLLILLISPLLLKAQEGVNFEKIQAGNKCRKKLKQRINIYSWIAILLGAGHAGI